MRRAGLSPREAESQARLSRAAVLVTAESQANLPCAKPGCLMRPSPRRGYGVPRSDTSERSGLARTGYERTLA